MTRFTVGNAVPFVEDDADPRAVSTRAMELARLQVVVAPDAAGGRGGRDRLGPAHPGAAD